VQDLAAFQRFPSFARVGWGTGELTSLAADAGISRPTAEAWISVLQASFLVFLVRPHFPNLSKRIIKTPKLYFCDPGLAGWLVGIREPGHLAAHPLRGGLFENWVMTELFKEQANRGENPVVHFWRDKEGHEVDAVIESGSTWHAIEIKAGGTVAGDFFDGLDFWRRQVPRADIRPWPSMAERRTDPRTCDRSALGQDRGTPWRSGRGLDFRPCRPGPGAACGSAPGGDPSFLPGAQADFSSWTSRVVSFAAPPRADSERMIVASAGKATAHRSDHRSKIPARRGQKMVSRCRPSAAAPGPDDR
jgi:hypothetical protein